jgi:FKBP-type peptidyl-prolyl cis-trans isomerase
MKVNLWLSVLAALALCLTPCLALVMQGQDKDKAKEKVVTTKSGLKYVDQKIGTGPAAKKGDIVTVHYTGWLENGKKFESSRGKRPYRFQLGARRVIRGWDEGLLGMKKRGKRKLIVPPELGYGPKENGPIPANSTLIFEVEMIKIEKDDD